MINEVKETYYILLEDEDFQHLPKEKLMDYAVQLVTAGIIKNGLLDIRSGLRGIEISLGYV